MDNDGSSGNGDTIDGGDGGISSKKCFGLWIYKDKVDGFYEMKQITMVMEKKKKKKKKIAMVVEKVG